MWFNFELTDFGISIGKKITQKKILEFLLMSTKKKCSASYKRGYPGLFFETENWNSPLARIKFLENS
jgi:hypothetical protein